MLFLHLSDLHLSRYGESGSWTQREDNDSDRWKPISVWQRWQIEGYFDKKGRPDRLRLVDPEGVVHRVKSWSHRKDEQLVAVFQDLAMERHRTSTERLVMNRPTAEELDEMLRNDPKNTNLRFLKILDSILLLKPEVIFITGDITNNGFGYEIVLHYLAHWINKGRLFTVPGNHDTYDIFPRLGRKARTLAKTMGYREFAKKLNLEPNRAGAYVRRMEDLAIVGLDSCKMPRTPLSASGAVSKEQLVWLRELSHDTAFAKARFRIGLMHHHLLRMPFVVGERSPIEMGMRLRNAAEVMEICTEAHLDLICNGHRHHGYFVQLPGRPTVVSAPSSTLGCKSTGQTYAWYIDFNEKYPLPLIHPMNGTK